MATLKTQLDGYRLTTAEITYYLPDRPILLQTYLWQEYDLAPRFPRLHEFLEFWEPKWPSDATKPAAFRRRLHRFNAEWREGTTHAFLIFGRNNGTLYGGITLSNVRRGVAQCGSVGYWVGEAHARNGVMSEALQLLLNYAFDTLGLHRIEAACLPSNASPREPRRRSHGVRKKRGVTGAV